MKRKATITVETERLLVVSRSHRVVEQWCQECRARVRMIPLEEAAAVAGVSQRRLFYMAEGQEIDLMEKADGPALFCANSLLTQRDQAARLIPRP
jgi:hypothetical protein